MTITRHELDGHNHAVEAKSERLFKLPLLLNHATAAADPAVETFSPIGGTPRTMASRTQRRYDTLILDLGDVLFTWKPPTETPIPPRTLHRMMRSADWFGYEKNEVSQAECYARLGKKFNVDPADIIYTLNCARDSLQANKDVILLIHELLENTHDTGLQRVFAASNISGPDWEDLKARGLDWSVFANVYTSAHVGERKPNKGFFEHVIRDSGVDPQRCIFVDDKLENVVTARSFGMYGIVFDIFDNVRRQLRQLLGDPVERGYHYLKEKAQQHKSETSTGVELVEDFSQMLILEATADESLVDFVKQDRLFNFFPTGEGQLTTQDFPADLDTTAIGLSATDHVELQAKHSVMDEMLTHVNSDGIIQVYFDNQRPRLDPVVCVNVLALFYSYGRGQQLASTLQWVYDVLENRAYTDGTLYYASAESFLFFLARLSLVPSFTKAAQTAGTLESRLSCVLTQRIHELIGSPGDALTIAMRIIACSALGTANFVDDATLKRLQCDDGSWLSGRFYKLPGNGITVGNRGLTTALAMNAILSVELHSSEAGTKICAHQLLGLCQDK